MKAVDIFAGPGGWDIAARDLGIDVTGYEYDADACQTRTNAGLDTIQADVSEVEPTFLDPVDGLIASPPCPAFSAAGKRVGVHHIDELAFIISYEQWHARPSDDPEVWLVLEVGRWAEEIDPTWIVCEQVPAVLPLWEAYRDLFRDWGYQAWCGILNAADYGVPQTRRRAILIAHKNKAVDCPPPTHAQYPQHTLFGDALAPWVTMADALGWPTDVRAGFPRLDDRGDSPDGYSERDWRKAIEQAHVLTEKARSWVVQRPATTVCGDPRLSGPGRNDPNVPGSQFGENSVKLDIREALLLQSFPVDYPLAGTRTSQFKQVGNAIPPLLARHILREAAA